MGVVFGELDGESLIIFLFLLEVGVSRAMSSQSSWRRRRMSDIVGRSSAGFQHSCIMSYLHHHHQGERKTAQ